MLSEEEIDLCIQDWSCSGWGDRIGEVIRISRAIESAACAERDARIAELEQQLAEARKDAEMLDWLDNNIFAREPDEWDQRYGVCRDGKTQMWAIFAPKGVHGSARRIIADAIRARGAK